MTKEFCKIMLLAGTILCSSISAVNAQTCTVAPTCESLGYTMSAANCTGKKTLKCPFDTNKLYCGGEDVITEDDNTIKPGYFVYDRQTITKGLIAGKTPIGIVVSTSPLTVAMYPLPVPQKSYATFYGSYTVTAADEDNGKQNSQTLLNNQDLNFEAINFCNKYSAGDISAGNWYLPAINEVKKYLSVRGIMTIVVAGGECIDGSYYSCSDDTPVYEACIDQSNKLYSYIKQCGENYNDLLGTESACRSALMQNDRVTFQNICRQLSSRAMSYCACAYVSDRPYYILSSTVTIKRSLQEMSMAKIYKLTTSYAIGSQVDKVDMEMEFGVNNTNVVCMAQI